MATRTLPTDGNVVQFPSPPVPGDGDGEGPEIIEVRIVLEGLHDPDLDQEPQGETEQPAQTRIMPFFLGALFGWILGG